MDNPKSGRSHSREPFITMFKSQLACVASVSVWFRSKERQRNGILDFGRARNETRAKKWKRGEGEGKVSSLPHPLPALSITPFFARSLTPVPRCLLLNRTETHGTSRGSSLHVTQRRERHPRSFWSALGTKGSKLWKRECSRQRLD